MMAGESLREETYRNPFRRELRSSRAMVRDEKAVPKVMMMMMVAIHPISALESIPIRESRATYAGCAFMGGKPRALQNEQAEIATSSSLRSHLKMTKCVTLSNLRVAQLRVRVSTTRESNLPYCIAIVLTISWSQIFVVFESEWHILTHCWSDSQYKHMRNWLKCKKENT